MEVDKVAKSVAVSLLFLKQSVGGYYKNVSRGPAFSGLACLELIGWTIFRVHSFFHDVIKADGSAASQPALSGARAMATVRTELAFLFL
eukprot:scaffold69001_cov63-Phaeocystis_antarctica.AAC.2